MLIPSLCLIKKTLFSRLRFVGLSVKHFIIAHLNKCCFVFHLQWVSLQKLLSHCTLPLSVNELWALCYTCLSTLQTYTDYPGKSYLWKAYTVRFEIKSPGNVGEMKHNHTMNVKIVNHRAQ